MSIVESSNFLKNTFDHRVDEKYLISDIFLRALDSVIYELSGVIAVVKS